MDILSAGGYGVGRPRLEQVEKLSFILRKGGTGPVLPAPIWSRQDKWDLSAGTRAVRLDMTGFSVEGAKP